MRAEEGRRSLTVTGLGARRASSHLSLSASVILALACASCAAPPTDDPLAGTETVIGRARWRGHVMLLTDTPALLAIDVQRMTMMRRELGPAGAPASSLWGLAEDDGRLFTIAAFNRLVEIEEGGALVDVAPLKRAVLNLVDLDAGMAAQLAGEGTGTPLLVAIDSTGVMAPFASPLRAALGLTPPEEGLLHLLSCSVPPRAICWLPGDARIFASEATALVSRTSLAGLSPPDAASLLAAPERRLIEDALRRAAGDLIVLRNADGAGSQRLTRYSLEGAVVADVVPPEPLRLLVADSPRGVLAVTRAGRPVIVEM